MREVQEFQINPVNIREQSQVTIINPDGGDYYLNILCPLTNTYYATSTISTTASASTFASAISGYYSTYYSASISVTLVMYDASSNVVTNSSLAYKYVYTITVNKPISTYTANYAVVEKAGTSSSISFLKPSNL